MGRRSAEGDDRAHRFAGEPGAAVEEGQFDDEGHLQEVAAEAFDQFDRGGRGSAGGEDVVDEEHLLAGADGVDVHREGVGAVFEAVAFLEGVEGQFALLADGDDARTEAEGDGGGEEEAAGVDAGDEIDLAWFPRADEVVDAGGEEGGVGEERGDVLELDPGLGEVGDVADGGLEVGG